MKFLVVVSIALVAVASADDVVHRPAAIVKQTKDISPDGSYSHSYETENGISHSETGTLLETEEDSGPVVVVEGEYHYTSPDGAVIAVQYVADQNGFQPQGAHIPNVPLLIQRALDYIRRYSRFENDVDNDDD